MKHITGFACAALLAAGVSTSSGCPDRKEAIDTVGGAPKTEIDNVHKRLDADEAKFRQAAEAADVKE